MNYRLITAFIFTILLTSQTNASSTPEIRLRDVLQASEQVKTFTSRKTPLQFQEPLKFKINGDNYTLRFFTFKNEEHPQQTFAETISELKKLNQPFKIGKNMPGVIHLSSSENREINSKEKLLMHYVVSIQPEHEKLTKIPTAEELLQAAPEIANFKSSPLAWPANEKSMLSLGNKKYQIRYFLFDMNKPEPTTFAQFVEDEELIDMNAELMDFGYGPLYVFRSSNEMKSRDINFVLSLGEVE